MLAAMAVMVGAPTLELNAWWTVLFGLLAAFYGADRPARAQRQGWLRTGLRPRGEPATT